MKAPFDVTCLLAARSISYISSPILALPAVAASADEEEGPAPCHGHVVPVSGTPCSRKHVHCVRPLFGPLPFLPDLKFAPCTACAGPWVNQIRRKGGD